MGLVKLTSNIFIKWLTSERDSLGFPVCDFERIRYEVRPCDVLLIEGRSRVSEVIKVITQSSWSHAALYIGRIHDIEDPVLRDHAQKYYSGSPDAQLLIEGVMGKGTVISPLSLYRPDHIRICRPRGLSPHDAQQVIGYAIKRLGTDYDVRQILDLARFMFPWTIMPRTWRSRLFQQAVGSSTKTVCSTMIAEAFSSVEFPILPFVKEHEDKGIELIQRNPMLFTPRDFDYSPYFEIIKYPFIEFENHAMYRKLPWNREGVMSHDGVNLSQSATASTATPPEKQAPSIVEAHDANIPLSQVQMDVTPEASTESAPQPDAKPAEKESEPKTNATNDTIEVAAKASQAWQQPHVDVPDNETESTDSPLQPDEKMVETVNEVTSQKEPEKDISLKKKFSFSSFNFTGKKKDLPKDPSEVK